MFYFIVFIISLLLIVALFAFKASEIFYGRKNILGDLLKKGDQYILTAVEKIKNLLVKINLQNCKSIIHLLSLKIKTLMVTLKRKFDHQQAHFFIKDEKKIADNNPHTSFFLKHVSDYKKKLRAEGEIKDIETVE